MGKPKINPHLWAGRDEVFVEAADHSWRRVQLADVAGRKIIACAICGAAAVRIDEFYSGGHTERCRCADHISVGDDVALIVMELRREITPNQTLYAMEPKLQHRTYYGTEELRQCQRGEK